MDNTILVEIHMRQNRYGQNFYLFTCKFGKVAEVDPWQAYKHRVWRPGRIERVGERKSLKDAFTLARKAARECLEDLYGYTGKVNFQTVNF